MHETPICFYNFESPAANREIPAGQNTLHGWLVPKQGEHFVDVRAVIGARKFPGVYGFPRADLAAHFSPQRPWLPAEFAITIDLAPGIQPIHLEALGLTGKWHHVGNINFAVRNSETARLPDADPISPPEFRRVIELALKSNPQPDSTDGIDTLARSIPHPRIVRPDQLPFRGYLAEPAAIAPALYGQMEVVGWLFHENQPIKCAYATTDLLTFQPLATGGSYAGVSERYPEQPLAQHCRLAGFVDVSTQLPAPCNVRIYAELADGSTHLCLSVHCRPITTEEIKAAFPPFSFWNFIREWRALKANLGSRKIRFETGAPLRAEFWRCGQEFRRMAAPPLRESQPRRAPPTAGQKKLRLLLITHNLNLEGAPLLFAEYARYLVEKTGAQVTVLSNQEGPLRQIYASFGVTVSIADINATTPRLLARQIRALGNTLKWNEIDLVVANTVACFWGVALAHAANRRVLWYIHESTNPATFFRRTHPALLTVVQNAFRSATAVSFNTSATSAYYVNLSAGENFHFNPAWIERSKITAFRFTHPRELLRSNLKLRPDELLVANIGTICERKGQHDFLRAIEYLHQKFPELAARCRFVMVGGRQSRYNERLQTNCLSLNRKNIELIPETSRVFDFIGAADLFVCTSYEESFPRVILEAMAFEVPIVSTNVHGIPHMLEPEADAVLIAPGDIHGLANGMRRILESPEIGQAMAASAFSRVKNFDASILLPHHAQFTAQVAGSST